MRETATQPLVAVKSKLGELNAVLNTPFTGGDVVVMIELLNSARAGGSTAAKVVQAGVQAVRAGRSL